MKYYLTMLLLLIIVTCNNAQDTGYKWTELTYHFQEGTVPPPYFYRYDLTLNTAGDITLVYVPDYVPNPDETWVYKLKVSQQNIDSLNLMLNSSPVFDSTIEVLPPDRTPIGGSLQNMVIVLKQDELLDQTPKRITTPYFPKNEMVKEALEAIYTYIITLVPQETWNEINVKKEEYIKKREK